ncbi:MAG: SLC13 family permease [Chloroflexota bacterium]|jgi:di/tricarboxylate transporter
MTPEIVLVLAILIMAVVLFVTEKLRMDLVALLVLSLLAVTRLVSPTQALAGFSNPAVVTIWAMFIISGGLSVTGIADILGRQVLRLAGTGEARLIAVIMTTAGVLSAFMNNVGVAAMMLPVVIDIARRTRRPASRLLMPLALGSLLGGLTTLIGTPPNLLVSDALTEYGLEPFQLLDFTPIGLTIMVAGILFVTLIGRHLLPTRDPVSETAVGDTRDLQAQYLLGERLFIINLPPDSPLAGKSLVQSRIGSALRLNVLAILRNGQTLVAPRPGHLLQSNDRLLVQGKQESLTQWHGPQQFRLEENQAAIQSLLAEEIRMAEAHLAPDSDLIGRTLYQARIRRRFNVNVLAIRRQGVAHYANLADMQLQAEDVLLLQGAREQLEVLTETADFTPLNFTPAVDLERLYHLQDRFVLLRIPPDSALVEHTLAESRLGDAYGLTVVGISRAGETELMPSPDTSLAPNDMLLVKGTPDELAILRGLQNLTIESQALPDLSTLETEAASLAEIILSPQSRLVDQTLREMQFRDKYGLTVLAIWRGGEAFRTDLRDRALRFGDAVLVYGDREKLRLLHKEPDFLVLTEPATEFLRLEKAPVAVLIMVAILLPVLLGYLSIAIAAVAGATLMVLTRCLTMTEAYRYIEWPAVFLIAGMLPLGVALEQTGAAALLAEGVIAVAGGMGPHAVVAAIFILTSLATQIIPTAALVVLMAPIAFNTAGEMGISPLTLMMTVAMAASASFASPVSHPANVMIMGPGGYRFVDYLKVGLPLTLVVLVLVVIFVPIFWPF